MALSFYFIHFIIFVIFVIKCAYGSSTLIPLSTAISPGAIEYIEIQFKPFIANMIRRDTLYTELRNCRLHIIKHAWDKTKETERHLIFSTYFGLHRLIREGQIDVVEFFMNDTYTIDMNHYPQLHFLDTIQGYDSSSNFYDGSAISFDSEPMTSLMAAVLLNRTEIVELLVKTSMKPKLKLDMAMKDRNLVTARSMARKIKNQSVRNVMLSKLKIDQNKHDMTIINYVLKEDLDINVKEAVIANKIYMMEAALLLGNFGDKNDVTIIKYAIENGNYLIIEALVMEGYAIPATKPIYPANLNKEDTDFILTDRAERVPLPKRKSWGSLYNEQCF